MEHNEKTLLAQQIRAKYEPKTNEVTKLDELKALDAKSNAPPQFSAGSSASWALWSWVWA